ncbi:hypothetical protein BGZ99_003673, partial [Dissophora globulifera]
FGHATRVNQIITELLRSTPVSSVTTEKTTGILSLSSDDNSTKSTQVATKAAAPTSRHTIYIVSDAPEFIFQDVIALGAIYRNAKVDAGVVQPLAYSVDRRQTIEGCKAFLSRRDEMIQLEVSWLAQVGADCVLADAPFLPCAAADAYGIPAILITNFTFDEVYRFLCEGDAFDRDVLACADAALQDYKKASLLLRLPGSIDIPAFEDEILAMETVHNSNITSSPSFFEMDDDKVEDDALGNLQFPRLERREQTLAMDIADRLSKEKDLGQDQDQVSLETSMGDTTPAGVMSPISMRTAVSSPSLSPSPKFSMAVNSNSTSTIRFSASSPTSSSRLSLLNRKAIDVPLVVRMAVNTREYVLRSLGVDDHTISTKKMALVSFGGQRLKQGWGNPLPEGWIGVICGLPVEHELPEGFYRSPHGVYVPDLTRAADVVIGKLGYGTCSECIAHETPLIYVPRPQFIEEHGLIKMMVNHGLAVEMTAEEFETGHWQRAIIEADRQAEEEKEGRRLHMESCCTNEAADAAIAETVTVVTRSKAAVVGESPVAGEMVTTGTLLGRRSRRSDSVSSLSASKPRGLKMMRLSPSVEDAVSSDDSDDRQSVVHWVTRHGDNVQAETKTQDSKVAPQAVAATAWFDRHIPNNGGEVCARLVEEFMAQMDECNA